MLDFEELNDFFVDAEFATTITRNDTQEQFLGVFGQEVIEANDTLVNILTNTLTVTCKSEDVVDFTQSSTLDIDDVTYRVTSISDDKTGITSIQVYKDE